MELNARPKASEWHKSNAGKKWHKEHYEKMKDKWHKHYIFNCLQCGVEFESTQIKSKYCSNKCKAKYYRQLKKGY